MRPNPYRDLLRCLSVVVCALGPFPAIAASAQQTPSEPTLSPADAEARGLYDAGVAAFSEGRFEEAVGYLQQAYALSHRVELLYNIGQAADRARRDELALESFRRYLDERPDDPRAPELRGRIRVLERAIEDRSDPGDSTVVAAPAAPEDSPVTPAASSLVSSAADPTNGPDVGAWTLTLSGAALAIAGVTVLAVAAPDLVPPREGFRYFAEVERQSLAEILTVSGSIGIGLGLVAGIVGAVLLQAPSRQEPSMVRVTATGMTVSF